MSVFGHVTIGILVGSNLEIAERSDVISLIQPHGDTMADAPKFVRDSLGDFSVP